MSLDWDTLIELRERRRRLALEAVAADRRAAGERLAQAQAAQARLAQQVAEQAGLRQAAVDAGSARALSVEDLRRSGAWHRVLDGRIAQAAGAAQEAAAAHARSLSALEHSRTRMLAAGRELEKAQQLQQRERHEQARAAQRRQDEAADESAVRGWTAGRDA